MGMNLPTTPYKSLFSACLGKVSFPHQSKRIVRSFSGFSLVPLDLPVEPVQLNLGGSQPSP